MIVWLISYPRSGNTFCRIVVESVFDVDDTYTVHYQDKTDRSLLEKIGIEYQSDDEYINIARTSDEVYFVKSHDLPDSKIDVIRDRFVYIVRDGRNATASYRHFLKDFSKKNITVMDIIVGGVMYGCWSVHVKKWLKIIDEDNGIVVKYEDLISTPISIAREISKLACVDVKEAKIPTFDELHLQRPKFFRAGGGQNWKKEFTHYEEKLFIVNSYEELIKFNYLQITTKKRVEFFFIRPIVLFVFSIYRFISKTKIYLARRWSS